MLSAKPSNDMPRGGRILAACLASLPLALGLGCSSPKAEGGFCSVGGELIPEGTLNPQNPCQVCHSATNAGGWSNIPAGAACGADGGSFCTGGSCQAGCYIDAIFYAPGAPAPSNGCLGCQPWIDPTGWSAVSVPPAGTCPQNGVCYQGHCQPGCTIGVTQVPAGGANPDNPCQSCQPGQNTVAWTDRPPGATCADGGAVCLTGACTAGCEIGGVFYAPGGQSPSNACQTCQPGLSIDGFSPATGLAPGGECGGGSYCYQGQCSAGCSIGGTSYAPGDSDPQSACLGCVPTVSAITWSNLDPGTPCAGGGVCSGGICLFGCDIGGVLIPPDTGNPSNTCQSCQPAVAAGGWSPLTGIPVDGCNGGSVCLDGGCTNGCFIKKIYYGPGDRKAGDVTRCCNPSEDPAGWSPAFAEGPSFSAPTVGTGFPYFYYNYYYSYYGTATQIAAADFNRDGRMDVAVLLPGANLGIYLNLVDGGFGLPATYTPSGLAMSLAIGDLNGDGEPDLVVATSDGGVSVFPGAGGGALGSESFYSSNSTYMDAGPDAGLYFYNNYYYTGPFGQTLSLADVNGDGVLDVLFSGGLFSTTFSVLLGIGDGGFQPGVPFDAGSFSTYQVVAADLKGNRSPDLLILGDRQFYAYPYYYYYPYSYYAYTYDPGIFISFNDGTGSFSEPTPLMGTSAGFQAADFNQDGLTDLSVPEGYGTDVAVMTAIGDGGFNAANRYFGNYGYQLAVGDFNGDGRPDLFVLDSYGSVLLMNNGDGTFSTGGTLPIPLTTQSATSVVAADFNGDGFDDLAVLNYGGTWTLWYNVCH